MHKLTILFLRAWMMVLSVGSFLFGWAVFAHSAKPAALNTANNAGSGSTSPAEMAPLPTLAPLPPVGQAKSQLQPLPSLPSLAGSFVPQPRLRSRGS